MSTLGRGLLVAADVVDGVDDLLQGEDHQVVAAHGEDGGRAGRLDQVLQTDHPNVGQVGHNVHRQATPVGRR